MGGWRGWSGGLMPGMGGGRSLGTEVVFFFFFFFGFLVGRWRWWWWWGGGWDLGGCDKWTIGMVSSHMYSIYPYLGL